MSKKPINLNDFSFDLVVRIDARNCRQLVIRLLAGIATLAVVATKATAWFEAAAR